MGKTFIEYMREDKPVNRIFVLRVALIGAFAGAVLATMFVMAALLQ